MKKVFYNGNEEPLVTSKATFDIFLKQENPADLIALYHFYYYTAKWQVSNQVKATTSYTAQGLKWSVPRVRKNKKILKELGFIEDIRKQDEETGHVVGYYIQLKFIWSTLNLSQTVDERETGSYKTLANLPTNALRTNNTNALRTNNKKTSFDEVGFITPKLFEYFWKHYPKKTDKGKALTSWNKICSRKNKERPKWKTIRTAIIQQKKTERWQNPKFIPLPTTWLHQSRWLDDPKEMVSWDNKPNNTGGYSSNESLTYKTPVKV